MKNPIMLVIHLTILAVMNNLTAQVPDEEKVKVNPFGFEATYTGDLVTNVKGGIQPGSVYMGLVDVGIGFNTDKAGWWQGGDIFFHAQNTHGGLASEQLVGDLQVLSNIECGNYTYLFELWYRQSFGKFSLLFGVNDFNAVFASSEYGGMFLNSAFGIHSSIALNIPVSIFPKTALGFIMNYDASDALSLRAAIYDGDPGSLEDDPHNLDWTVSKDEGYLLIGEMEYRLQRKENWNTIRKEGILLGTYKLGAYYHSGSFENTLEGSVSKGNYGFYMLADQVIIPRSIYVNKSVSTFVQLGWCPSVKNINRVYLGTGFNLRGLLFGRHQDILGIGIAHAKMNNEAFMIEPEIIPGINPLLRFETAIEISYKAQLTDNIAIQPDLHYIINPGANEAFENAFVPSLRLEIGISY